jgi:hypothetical protein
MDGRLVSYSLVRRASILSLVVTLSFAGCSRRVEVENAPEGAETPITEPPRPDGGVPVVADAGLDAPELQACVDRPNQTSCRGANDFGCAFDAWLIQVIRACHEELRCMPNGWLEVQTDIDGCGAELRMEDPRPPFVACLTEQLTEFRCPCPNVTAARYLGASNPECAAVACGTGELRCPPAQRCVDGLCEAAGAGASSR